MPDHEQVITTAQIVEAMQTVAPAELAEPWDSVGLQVGDPQSPVASVLLTLDVTAEAIRLALENDCTLIISHHPLIFNPLTALCRNNPLQALVMSLVEHRISVLAAHTNLDAAAGGVADCLADRLTGSLFSAGYGRATVQGTVAIYGRLVDCHQPVRLSDIAAVCLTGLGAAGCFFNTDQDRPVQRIAVFPGSFSETGIGPVRAAGTDCVLCGESKHSAGIELSLSQIAQVIIGHDVSERVVLLPLADRLRVLFPQIRFAVYKGLVYNNITFRVSRTAAGVKRKATREESPGSKGQGAG